MSQESDGSVYFQNLKVFPLIDHATLKEHPELQQMQFFVNQMEVSLS